MSDKTSRNKVVTYEAGVDKNGGENAEVSKALSEGYQVIDVIQTPCPAASYCWVTVVMSNDPGDRYNWNA